MRAALRAASASASEPAIGTDSLARFPAVRRLRSPAQFVAVTSDPQSLRAARRWLAIAGHVRPAIADRTVPVRFGFTAAKRYARRACDRNTVKRVLREAARVRIEELDRAAGARAVDVVMRLKAAAPDRQTVTRDAWKKALRAEADALLDDLARQLRRDPRLSA